MTAAYGSQVEKSRPRKIKLVLQDRQLHMTATYDSLQTSWQHMFVGGASKKASVRNGS